MPEYVLIHHGIKGQKWGVRRFQNGDGSLTNAGKRRYKKELKKEYKQKKMEISRKAADYDTEFEEKTSEGKKLRKQFDKAYKDYFDADDDDPKLEKKFLDVEEKFLRAGERYVAERLVKEYGNDLIVTYVNSGRVELGKDAVEYYVEKQWQNHTV